MRDLPRACYKHQLKKRLIDVPDRLLTEKINQTIALCRDIDEAKAKKRKKLTKKECKAVMVYFGEIDE